MFLNLSIFFLYLPGTGTGEANLNFYCDGFNNVHPITGAGFCANVACKVEGKFVLDIFNNFIAGGSIDHSMHHAANFDYDNTCVSSGKNNGPSDKQCCGDFPIRKPYNAAVKECCNDGFPRLQC